MHCVQYLMVMRGRKTCAVCCSGCCCRSVGVCCSIGGMGSVILLFLGGVKDMIQDVRFG